jgi:hypothetical protein
MPHTIKLTPSLNAILAIKHSKIWTRLNRGWHILDGVQRRATGLDFSGTVRPMRAPLPIRWCLQMRSAEFLRHLRDRRRPRRVASRRAW